MKTLLSIFIAALPAFIAALPALAGDWTAPVTVMHDTERCVSYRARLNGEYLMIQAMHEPGWHTNAMDNQKRADEKLAGKKALGVDKPTGFELSGPLQVAGPWFQTVPKDASKPDLLWYTWTFEKTALFVAKVRRVQKGTATIGISGQACSESTCKNIDLELAVPVSLSEKGFEPIDMKALIAVR